MVESSNSRFRVLTRAYYPESHRNYCNVGSKIFHCSIILGFILATSNNGKIKRYFLFP